MSWKPPPNIIKTQRHYEEEDHEEGGRHIGQGEERPAEGKGL